MFYKPLVQDFVTKYKYTFIGYVLLIVLFFPIEGIVLPKVYGKVFEKIKVANKFRKNYPSISEIVRKTSETS